MHLEHSAQARGAENPQDATAADDQPEPAATCQDPVPRPAQDTQSRAVDEGHGTQVDDQVGARTRGQRVQASGIAVTRSISPCSATIVVPSTVCTGGDGASLVRFSDIA